VRLGGSESRLASFPGWHGNVVRIAVYVLLFPLVIQMAELSPYSCSVSVTQCVDVLSR